MKTVAKDTGKVALKVTEVTAEDALPIAADFIPVLVPVNDAVKVAELFAKKGGTVNPLEAMGITLVLGMLQSVVKNPAHKTLLQNQLLGVADDIYEAYGLTPADSSLLNPTITPTAASATTLATAVSK